MTDKEMAAPMHHTPKAAPTKNNDGRIFACGADSSKRSTPMSRVSCESCGEVFERRENERWKRRCRSCWKASAGTPGRWLPLELGKCVSCGSTIRLPAGMSGNCPTCAAWRRWYNAHQIGAAALQEVGR